MRVSINSKVAILYRVVDADSWRQAQQSGWVPRCGADQRADWVHLNVQESLKVVTPRYFHPSDKPVALAIAVDHLQGELVWLEPTEEKPWIQPCAKIANLPLSAVVSVIPLTRDDRGAEFLFPPSGADKH
ncbi:DUF952 domain-containing protein [Ferrimonas marina]|uniref:Uncharacterized conserved protein, DUF952 family n=1 Tax=Ferrimonas marina TaxID=299255 RepID=A0A1M5P6Q9_9GAMM|nr:DUF952 domain-containing protein [Ferrimonas marina]SHG97395.1 Uncharacterized conserved protein, DUF952 family [Ferrimonas marina]